MEGFRKFLMRGNLIELAVAVIIGGAFTAVVTAFTNMLLDVIGRFGQVPDFSRTSIVGIGVGAFLSALLGFVFTSAIVYFLIVLPYNRLASLRQVPHPVAVATTEGLLAEIRDLLRAGPPVRFVPAPANGPNGPNGPNGQAYGPAPATAAITGYPPPAAPVGAMAPAPYGPGPAQHFGPGGPQPNVR